MRRKQGKTRKVINKVEPSKRENSKVEPSKRENLKVEPSKRENFKVEPSKRENLRLEPTKWENQKLEPPKGEKMNRTSKEPTKWEKICNKPTDWEKVNPSKQNKNGSIMTRMSSKTPTHYKMQNSKNRNQRRREKRRNERLQANKENRDFIKQGITILYANANGIGDKAKSLESAASMINADILAITETKQIPPKIDGYVKWFSKERKDRQGGGVAITIREDLAQIASKCTEFDDEQEEIVWMELKASKDTNVYICTYYGKQEKAPMEEVENEYANICTQVEYFKKKGEVILTGDFNAKLYIEKQGILQKQSPHGQILQNMIDFSQLHVASLHASKGVWTRQNRNKAEERSVIDYILVTDNVREHITETIIDEEGHMRIKGRKESDHNTIIIKTGIQTNIDKYRDTKWAINKAG